MTVDDGTSNHVSSKPHANKMFELFGSYLGKLIRKGDAERCTTRKSNRSKAKHNVALLRAMSIDDATSCTELCITRQKA